MLFRSSLGLSASSVPSGLSGSSGSSASTGPGAPGPVDAEAEGDPEAAPVGEGVADGEVSVVEGGAVGAGRVSGTGPRQGVVAVAEGSAATEPCATGAPTTSQHTSTGPRALVRALWSPGVTA